MTPDSLYRVSLKSIITNEQGLLLVVKEADRSFWDLPGGGMDHGETIREALARELYEEVKLEGEFDYHILMADEPHVLPSRPVHQIRLVFRVTPKTLPTQTGVDADEIDYVDPVIFKDSEHHIERNIYKYSRLLS